MTSIRFPPTIDVHVVHVREVDAPHDMKAVEWILLTTEEVDTIVDVLRVVDIYRARWTIEELFKACRAAPDAPSTTVLTSERLEVLRAIARKPLGETPTARDILLAIAALGGHLPKNGAPGWQTLRRCVDRLLVAEEGWLARERAGLQPGRSRSGG